MKLFLSLKFDPHDMWVGAFWKKGKLASGHVALHSLTFYVCLIFMLPIRVQFTWAKHG